MKKTIREDQERMILESTLLNDNTLLEYTADHGRMVVGVRFVDSPLTGIKEHILLNMNIVEYMKNKEELIEINEDSSAIATFTPTEEGFVLKDVYDTIEHQFGYQEFVELEYKKRFPNKPLKGQYIKTKK